jgi:hypothetical protein
MVGKVLSMIGSSTPYIVGTKFTRSLFQAIVTRAWQERAAGHVVNRAQKSRQKSQSPSGNSL